VSDKLSYLLYCSLLGVLDTTKVGQNPHLQMRPLIYINRTRHYKLDPSIINGALIYTNGNLHLQTGPLIYK